VRTNLRSTAISGIVATPWWMNWIRAIHAVLLDMPDATTFGQ
jgi:hypothetical protein